MESFAESAWRSIARLGTALSDPNRLKILQMLVQAPRSGEELADMLGLTSPNVSAHLRVLSETNFVTKNRVGKRVYYSVANESVHALFSAVRDGGFALNALVREELQRFADDDPLEELNVEELKEKVARGEVLIIDARPAEEYLHGHLPFAVSFPLSEFESLIAAIPSNVEVIVYCRGPFCAGAKLAVQRLRQAGVRARRWKGGVLEWKLRGNTLEKAEVEG